MFLVRAMTWTPQTRIVILEVRTYRRSIFSGSLSGKVVWSSEPCPLVGSRVAFEDKDVLQTIREAVHEAVSLRDRLLSILGECEQAEVFQVSVIWRRTMYGVFQSSHRVTIEEVEVIQDQENYTSVKLKDGRYFSLPREDLFELREGAVDRARFKRDVLIRQLEGTVSVYYQAIDSLRMTKF